MNEISLDCRISESPKRESCACCADQSSIDPVDNDNGYVTSPCLNSPVNFNGKLILSLMMYLVMYYTAELQWRLPNLHWMGGRLNNV